MVFSSTRHHVKPEIYLQRVDGTSVTQLTSDPAEDVQPVFSPDGKHIAFASTRAGSWDIYAMDLDGKNVTQVTSGPAQDMHPSFSPDGTRLAYCSIGGRSNQWELWVVNLATRERKMIGYGLFPSWSPDKNVDRIAYQRARQRGSRWFSLWTVDLVDGEARRITEVAVSSNAAIVTPVWAPDGKRLAFATIVEPAQMNKGKLRGQQDIWVIDADGGNRHRVTDGTGTNLCPSWAADNRVYFISDRGGQENIWSVRAEGRVTSWPVAKQKSPDAVGSTDPDSQK
jgi:Tol biopolymer transport system component